MITANFEAITPELAKQYLMKNSRNRPIKPSTVREYARDMLNGKFLTTHQGIAFDENGVLSDGQHRLLALVASGKTLNFLVSRGLPPETTAVIDRGTTRSVRDVFLINRKGDPSLEAKMLTSSRTLSALSQLANCNVPSRLKLSSNDYVQMFDAFKDATTKVFNRLLGKSRYAARAPIFAAAIAAVDCGVDIEAVERFFSVLLKDDATGCQDYNLNAALNWKRQLDAAKASRVQIDRRRLYLGTQNAIYHFVGNTGVSRVSAPNGSRYDVSSKVASIFGLEDTNSKNVGKAEDAKTPEK